MRPAVLRDVHGEHRKGLGPDRKSHRRLEITEKEAFLRIVRYTPNDACGGGFHPGSRGPSPRLGPFHWGVIEGDWIVGLMAEPFGGISRGKGRYSLSDVRLLPPVSPGKIIAIGLNFEDHIKEMGSKAPPEPLIFLKAPSAVIGPGDAIALPPESARVDYEGELAVVVGRRCRRIDPSKAREAILGYTILNDVTARDLQKKDVQFSRAKSFDTFCPIGPWIETELDPSAVRITTVVNSRVKQDGHTSAMRFPPHQLMAFISSVMTLEPGDIIATGTPAGVGPLSAGDAVSVAVEGIGVLTNPVVREGQ